MKGIDLLKLFFSLVVVWIHTGVGTLGGITPIAVPFFFAVSGFFFFGKLFDAKDNEDKDGIFFPWFRKILRLYVIWTLIFLPFAIWGYYQDQTPFLKALVIYIRNFLFVGENYLSWPLWYLLGMLWSGLIIWGLSRIRTPFWAICVIAVLLYFGRQYIIQGKLAELYYHIFKTTRNGLFIGFPFMVLGGLLRRILPPMKTWTPGSWQQKSALYFRYLSIHIYLSHMIWAGIMIICWGFERGIVFWAITCALSIITGIFIRPCDPLIKFLYGRTYRT